MPRAKYDEIYTSLKRAIEVGDYPYGSLLQSENTQIVQYGCFRNTIRRVLAGLGEDGYVQPILGKGVRVLYRSSDWAAFTVGGIESFQETAQRNGVKAGTRVIRFFAAVVDRPLSEKSGFPEGEQVYYIERVRCLDNKPLIFDINMLLKSLLPRLTAEIAERSIYVYIDTELGMQIVTSKRTVMMEHAMAQKRRE